MKEEILNTVSDLVGEFLYYGRKEDEDLPIGAIQKAINNGDISVEEIESMFSRELRQSLAN